MPGEKGSNGDVTLGDHPLSINPDSQWSTFFRDNEVLLQIDKDVRRYWVFSFKNFYQAINTDFFRTEILHYLFYLK